MNDKNKINHPSWANPRLQENVVENHAPEDGTNGKENQTLTRSKEQQPHQQLSADASNRTKRDIGSFCYNFISMIGHCGELFYKKVGAGLKNLFAQVTGRQSSSAHEQKPFSIWVRAGLSIGLVVLICSGFLYYSMGARALPVAFLKERIELALSNSLGRGIQVGIDEVWLQRDPSRGGLYLRLTNVVMKEPNGGIIASSPQTAIGLKALPLIVGSVVPDSLSLIGPEVHLVRNEQGDWNFWRKNNNTIEGTKGVTKSEDPEKVRKSNISENEFSADKLARIGDIVRQGLARTHAQLQQSSKLSYIGVRKARIILHQKSQEEDQVWLLPSFTAQYDQTQDNRLIGSGVLQPETAPGSEMWLSLAHSEGKPFFDMKARLQNVVPSQLTAFIPALSSLSSGSISVSGAFTGQVDLNEGLHEGHLKAILSKGDISLFGQEGPRFEVTRGAFEFNMEPGVKHIVMRQGELFFPSGKISLNGNIWRDDAQAQTQNWNFQLKSSSGEIVSQTIDDTVDKIDEFNFSGRLFATKTPISIDEIRLKIGQSLILMAHDSSQGYPAILRGRFSKISLPLLKAVWPQNFKQQSRDWVFENVQTGLITSGRFALKNIVSNDEAVQVFNQTPGSRKKTTEQLPNLQFQVQDLSYSIFDDPILIKTPKANIKITGDELLATMKKGTGFLKHGGRLNLTDGQFAIPDLKPVVTNGIIKFKLASDAQTIVSCLNSDPFHYNLPIKETLKGFKGNVTGGLTIKMPLKDDVQVTEVDVDGAISLANASAKTENLQIKDGMIKFSLGKNHVEAKGSLFINGAATTLAWSRKFNAPANYSPPALYLRAKLDAADRNQLGLNINDMVQGELPIEIAFKEVTKRSQKRKQKLGDKFDIHVNADLTKTTLLLNHLGWRKEKGRAANLELDVTTNDKGDVALENIQLKGKDLAAQGRIELDDNSNIKLFKFPQITYKVVSNISLAGVRHQASSKKKIWKIKASGKTYDARGLLRSLLQKGGGDQSASTNNTHANEVELSARFKTVIGWKQSNLHNFNMDLKRKGSRLTAFKVKGAFSNSRTLTGKLLTKNEPSPTIQINTDNAGEAFRFIGFYPNMLGGRGKLIMRNNDNKQALASKTGRVLIKDFSISSDPVVREVIANGPAGISSQKELVQDTISFSRLAAPFSIGQGQFILHDSHLKGDILGATMRGKLDFNRNRVRLSGTYIPLYGLNAAVGAVPVIGELLVGRQGEGILGITFGVYGNIQKPEVLVNPMSLVAPGVFRQIFEFQQGKQKIKKRKQIKRENSTKLDTSASKVRRRSNKNIVTDQRVPETSASSVQRK